MDRTEIYIALNDIFRSVFDDEDIVVGDATTSNDIEDWDSLEQINLIVAVEQRFGIKFSMGEVESLENVGAMVDIIQVKTQA